MMSKGFAEYPSSFGVVRVEYEDDQVTRLDFRIERDLVPGTPTLLTDQVCLELNEYFAGRRQTFDFPLLLRGTEFQRKVWAALLAIPYGETRSYREIAEAVGSPRAFRAVGMANHNNPVSIAVPCHRVIGSDGRLVGYGGGLPLKERLLELERKHKDG